MIRQKTDEYVKVCVKTWLLCEANVHTELNSDFPRKNLVGQLDECAKACFAVVGSLLGTAGEQEEAILNCLINCRSCSLECKKYPDEEDIFLCSAISGICADCMNELFVFALN